MDIPKSILKNSYKAKWGDEYAWKAENVPHVLQQLEENQYAIIGGCIWLVKEDNVRELYWLEFKIDDRYEFETWSNYVTRSIEQFKSEFDKANRSKGFYKELKESERVYYNIGFVNELDYNDQLRDFNQD